MLRDLATVLEDLQEALQGYGRMHGALHGTEVRLERADLTLPMDFTAILRDGSCVLLADVNRSRAATGWVDQPSRLHLVWVAVPVAELPQ
jgi:hypothetical protein